MEQRYDGHAAIDLLQLIQKKASYFSTVTCFEWRFYGDGKVQGMMQVEPA
jgi:hypothetical protein